MKTKTGMKKIEKQELLVAMILTILSLGVQARAEEPKDYFNMSLEELMDQEVSTTSLTGSTRRIQPGTVTTIEKEDIRRSGARSLDELLLIYVPNLQQRMDIRRPTHLGLRGINADIEDKYLIVVNGRVMNERSNYGALTERDMPMLGDIERIEVIRGGGSALYGPGAISMVINITTENAKTFKGTQVTSRAGAIEEYYSGEFKHTWDLGKDEGLYLYAGMSRYLGADGDDAPTYAADWYNQFNPTDPWVDTNKKSYAYRQHGPDYHESFRPDRPKVKVFADYTKEDFDLWFRFTQGGMTHPTGQNRGLENGGMGYQQYTMYAKQLFELTSDLTFELVFSYDLLDVDRNGGNTNVNGPQNEVPVTTRITSETYSYSEQEYFTKGLFRWDINQDHHLAFGTEYVYNYLGKDGYGYPSSSEATGTAGPATQAWGRWESDMLSAVGEYQWNITDVWTLFLGGRIDRHEFTKNMYSPRAALVYAPTEKDTVKFMISRSTRTNLETYLKQEDWSNNDYSETELTDNYEIRYERQQTKNFSFGGGPFFQDRQPIQWSSGTNGPVGNIHAWGLEGEMAYRTEDWRLSLSHSFTKMYDNELPGNGEIISASGYSYGGGNDYAHWDDHCTKLIATWFVDKKLSIDSTLQAYWGSNGAEDYAKLRDSWFASRGYPRPSASGYDVNSEIYNYSLFLNFGVEYKWSTSTLVRVDFYNVLGWFDDDINGIPHMYNYRNTGQQMQIAPAAIGVTFQHSF